MLRIHHNGKYTESSRIGSKEWERKAADELSRYTAVLCVRTKDCITQYLTHNTLFWILLELFFVSCRGTVQSVWLILWGHSLDFMLLLFSVLSLCAQKERLCSHWVLSLCSAQFSVPSVWNKQKEQNTQLRPSWNRRYIICLLIH